MASKQKGELLSVFESKGITDENVQTLYYPTDAPIYNSLIQLKL